MTTITQWISSPIDSFKKWQAGPRPDISPKSILAEIGKDSYMNGMEFKLGKRSLICNSIGHNFDQRAAVQVVQKGLIALGLIKVDRATKYWWSNSNFAWGTYGPSTKAAAYEIQTMAGIKNGQEGRIFGPESLDNLKVALAAKAEGKDWKTAITKPQKK